MTLYVIKLRLQYLEWLSHFSEGITHIHVYAEKHYLFLFLDTLITVAVDYKQYVLYNWLHYTIFTSLPKTELKKWADFVLELFLKLFPQSISSLIWYGKYLYLTITIHLAHLFTSMNKKTYVCCKSLKLYTTRTSSL